MASNRRQFVAACSAALAWPALGKHHAPGPADDLIRRPIPSSGETIPAVGLGTSRTFDVSPSGDIEAQRAVFDRFVELGGTVVDTSPMYGQAEALVGHLARESSQIDKLFYATKVWTDGGSAGREQMAESGRLMHTPVIDLMQVHNLRDLETHLRSVRELREAGTVRYVGVTHYRVDMFEALERVMTDEPLDFVQLNYSIATRDAEERLLPLAQEKGIAIMVNRAYEAGRLFGQVKGRPLPEMAADLGVTSWGQYFLKYVLGHPAVTVVIPATAKVRHLEDNMAAGRGPLPDDSQRQAMVAAL